MDKILDLIKTRRCIRSYLEKPVERKVIEEIIDCARYSPTALGREPWHFTVVTDRGLIKEMAGEVRKKLRVMLKFKLILRPLFPDLKDKKFLSLVKEKAYSSEDRIFYNAPVLILISTSRKTTHGIKDSFLAVQNILLAAHSLGLGTCIIGFAEAMYNSKKLLNRLNLPPRYRIQAVLTLGYPKAELSHLPERRKDNLYFV